MVFGKLQTDERVNAFIGYCPYCPVHEGLRTHARLIEMTREFRQCPRCQRLYCVADPPRDDVPTGSSLIVVRTER